VDGAVGASNTNLVAFGEHVLYIEANIGEGGTVLREFPLEVL
jgi:hypothetical protein